MAVVVDISDRAIIARAEAARRRRDLAIFATLRTFHSTTYAYPYLDLSDNYVELVGRPKAELLEEPTRPIVEDERRHWREQYLTGQIVHTRPRLVLANKEIVQYRMVMVPMRDATGAIEGWSNYVAPLHLQSRPPVDVMEALEQRVQGYHVRAGRALLGWTMGDLAGASGLSVSTIRRLEDDSETRTPKTIRASVAALRRHGVHFALSDEASIVIGKT